MTHRRSREYGGSSLLEFTLVGIPLIFILISTFEISRGMWIYHTLAYGVKQGSRYTAVHGFNCGQTGNTCTVTLGQIAAVIQNASVGLDTSQMYVTFTPASGTATGCLLKGCMTGTTGTTVWPPSGANSPGQSVSISATYPFRSMIAMFWPGTRGGALAFAAVYLPASSRDIMQF